MSEYVKPCPLCLEPPDIVRLSDNCMGCDKCHLIINIGFSLSGNHKKALDQ